MPAARRVGGAIAAALAAASVTTVGAAVVPGPAAQAAPAMTVEPATGLVDGEHVTITVTGLTPDSWVDVAQCAAAPVDIYDDCDLADGAYAIVGNDGTATMGLRVDAVIRTGFGFGDPGREVDCRGSACVIGLSGEGGTTLMTAPLGFVPDAPLAPPPTVSVTPDVGLVDMQPVMVEASGLVWSTSATVAQCAADPAGLQDCDLASASGIGTTDAGALTTEFLALALIETDEGRTVDCREPGACVLAVSGDQLRSPAKSALAPLAFEADADVATPTLAVSPDADLVDGQTVTVDGSGFRPAGANGSWVEIYECPTEASYDTCSWVGWSEVDADGAFTTELPAWAILTTPAGEVDCRDAGAGCQLVATPGSLTSVRAGRAALHFAEDGPLLPAPSIDVSPSRDLADGAEVAVAGIGFTPDRYAFVSVCQADDLDLCDPDSETFAPTSASGTFSVSLGAAASFESWTGDAIDCLGPPGCVVAAEDGARGRVATAELTFAAPADEGQRYLDPVFDEVDVTRDLVYRETTDGHGMPVQLTLDLYQPAGDTAGERPVVVWTRGGWFDAGDEPLDDTYAREFARRGYVVALVDHRRRPELGCCPTRDAVGIAGAIADATDDVAAAVAWLQDHASEHRLDQRSFAAGGTEGGGAVSFGLAYPGQGRGGPAHDDDDHDGGDGMHAAMSETTSVVAAAVPVSGVALGEPQPGAAPVLAFHGGADLRAPAHLSEWTCAAAGKVGARCDVASYAGASDIAASKRRDIVRRASAFIAEVVLTPLGYFDDDQVPATTTTSPPAPAAPPAATTTTEPAGRGGDLPRTGADSTLPLVRIGAGATAAGAGLLVLSIRRRRRADAAGTQGD